MRIHCIRRPDQDRHMHSHPWNARTIILLNGYDEDRLEYPPYPGPDDFRVARYRRRAGDTAPLRFEEYHQIVKLHREAWTLFITWKYRGTWGFLVNGKKVPWREYLNAGKSE